MCTTHRHFSGINGTVRRSTLVSSIVVDVIVAIVIRLWATVMSVVVATRRSTSFVVVVVACLIMMMDFVTGVGPAVMRLVATSTTDCYRRGLMYILLPHGFVEPPQHVIERIVRHLYLTCM